MNSSNTIRVFVGCAPNGEDAESQAVLEYTLRTRASRSVQLTWMKQTHDRKSFWHGWNTRGWSTPFTGFRWGIPAFCNYEGRAIYMDSDVIIMADIAELFDQPMSPGVVLKARSTEGKPRYCVTLFDCAEAGKYLPSISSIKSDARSNKKITDFFRKHSELCEKYDGNWNCIDGDQIADLADPRIKIIHYSWMNHQPHLPFAEARLAKDKRIHWFDGRIRPHWRPDLIDLFKGTFDQAESAGYRASNYYDPSKPYVQIQRKSYKDSRVYGEA